MSIPGVQPILWNINDAQPAPAADVLVTERPLDPAHRSRVAGIAGLKHVHLLSIGYEWVIEHLPAGVALSNSRSAVEDATAEHCLALVLASLRELPVALAGQRDQKWPRTWTSSLHGSSVVVLGTGGVGSAIIDRILPFKPAKLIGIATTARQLPNGVHVHPMAQAQQFAAQADVVIIALPHTAQTEGLVDSAFLSSMKDGALLVNIGRGPIVKTADLITELISGRLRAALDVTDPEPLPSGHPLWSAPACIITPHMAGDTGQFLELVSDLATRQIVVLAAGGSPLNLVG